MNLEIAMLISLLFVATTVGAIILIEYYHEIRYGLYTAWEKIINVLTFRKHLRY